MPARKLAQTRPGARGALLLHAALPASEFEAWPDGFPVQIHAMEADEWFEEDKADEPLFVGLSARPVPRARGQWLQLSSCAADNYGNLYASAGTDAWSAKLTSPHVISLIALFVALGGTAGAASVKRLTGADIRDGSLSGVDIGHESLKGKHLRNGSLTGLDLRDGSLGIQDFAPADLAKLKGEAGDRGPAGAKGDTGATGPAGSSATLETATSTGGGVTNYQNGNPIVAGTAAVAGYYLVIVTGTVTNTGASDDYLNCGFDVAGTISGAEGFQTTAGNPTTGSSITLASTNNPAQAVTFVCFGNGVTTFDVGSMQMKLIKLADR